MVRDLDIAQGNSDSRRLEVIAEGLSLFGGVQLALDATLVFAHHGDGTPLRKADTTNRVEAGASERQDLANVGGPGEVREVDACGQVLPGVVVRLPGHGGPTRVQ